MAYTSKKRAVFLDAVQNPDNFQNNCPFLGRERQFVSYGLRQVINALGMRVEIVKCV